MRAIAPATPSDRSDQADRSSSAAQRRAPRATVSQACVACRRRKSRCNGGTPCAQCVNKSTECEYIDRPRPHEMRKSLQDKDTKLEGYLGLINALRTGTDADAHDLLRGLREAEDVDDYIADLREGEAPIQRADGSVNTNILLPLGWSTPTTSSTGSASRRELEKLRRSRWHPTLQLTTTFVQGPGYGHVGLTDPDILSPAHLNFPETFSSYQNVSLGQDEISFDHPSFSGFRTDEANVIYPFHDPSPPPDLLSSFSGCSLQHTERSRHRIAHSYSLDQTLHPNTYPANGYVQVFGNLPMSSAIIAGGFPDEIRERQLENFRIPVYLIQPLCEFEDSPLARAWLDYRDQARLWLANGSFTLDYVLGQNEIEVDLAFRDRGPHDPHNVAAWACDFVKAFPEIDLWLKLASIALLTRLMRWMVNPTSETYRSIPDMMKPTLAQRMIPHSPVIEPLALPCVRDHLITELKDYLSILLPKCTVEWELGFDEAVQIDPVTNRQVLSAHFEDHVAQLSNWSVTRECVDAFPSLLGPVKIRQS